MTAQDQSELTAPRPAEVERLPWYIKRTLDAPHGYYDVVYDNEVVASNLTHPEAQKIANAGNEQAAELRAYRAALERISQLEGGYYDDPVTLAGELLEQIRSIAQSALKGAGE